jgi:hypothetical protein
MFGPSYSSKSMLLAVTSLRELESRIEDDFKNYPPMDIPKDHED